MNSKQSPNLLANIRRYTRAFVIALQFTLRGQKPPLLQIRERYPQLAAWWMQTISSITSIEQRANVDQIHLESIKIHIDRREQSAATILSAIKFHAERDYPYLLAHDPEFGQMTLQATNLNDRYLLTKLIEVVDPSLKTAVEALNQHLAALPSENAHES